jgi:hypothetical protein
MCCLVLCPCSSRRARIVSASTAFDSQSRYVLFAELGFLLTSRQKVVLHTDFSAPTAASGAAAPASDPPIYSISLADFAALADSRRDPPRDQPAPRRTAESAATAAAPAPPAARAAGPAAVERPPSAGDPESKRDAGAGGIGNAYVRRLLQQRQSQPVTAAPAPAAPALEPVLALPSAGGYQPQLYAPARRAAAPSRESRESFEAGVHAAAEAQAEAEDDAAQERAAQGE